jgi:uncharacterized protein with NRDE domain
MCLVLVVWRMDSKFPCVIAANRDELHSRPARQAQWWPDQPDVFGGRDLAAGGTWFGLTRSGRFAALTNYRDPARPAKHAPSRGALVASWLQSHDSLASGLDHLREVGPDYHGFNMIFSDGERLGIYESTTGSGRELASGIYGLSNHLLDTSWPKVENAKSRLTTALDDLSNIAPVLELLRDDIPAPDERLPRTGVSLEWERLLSSAFVRAADYGTRSSTIVRIDSRRRAYFDEWSWDAVGESAGSRHAQFDLE